MKSTANNIIKLSAYEVLLVLSTFIVNTYGGCEFKSEWNGKWFISGAQNVMINSTWIETKGQCVENINDKYLIEDRSDNCFRCMVIHEKHTNVLQYKETYCDDRDTLDNLCNQIPGDAVLYSMFRVNPLGGSVQCPFKGPPFTFTYNRGSGECTSPVSRVDSCTDDSRMLFRYQACPDVEGTESTIEELVCLATWKDGSIRYLVGKLSHIGVNSDEDSYRCFVYERITHDDKIKYNVAQSGDATCNGLISAVEGSKTMRLTKVENSHTRCKYPSWITDHHHWHTLDFKKSYHFSHKNSTLRITQDPPKGQRSQTAVTNGLVDKKKQNAEMRVVCHSEVKSDANTATLTAHITSGCESGYVCMTFYRRDAHVVELQQSTTVFAHVPEDACSSNYFNPSTLNYVTLITSTLHQRKCPHIGRFAITGQNTDGVGQVVRSRRQLDKINNNNNNNGKIDRKKRDGSSLKEKEEVLRDCNNEEFEALNVGCSGSHDTMQFQSSCSQELNSAYSCHGSWEENGTYYLIASPLSRKSTEAHHYCFISNTIYDHNTGLGGSVSSTSSNNKETTSDPRQHKNTISKLMLSTVADSCYRNIKPGINGIRTFNLSLVGQCAESVSSDSGNNITVPSLLLLTTILALLYSTR